MKNSLWGAPLRDSLATVLVLLAPLAQTALGLVAEDTTGITDPPADDPGFASTTLSGRTGVYLSDSWVLTARHVAQGTPIRFDGGSFDPIPDQSFVVPNPPIWGGQSLSAETDLRLDRYDGKLNVPDLTIASSSLALNDEVVMIGDANGREANPTTWYIDTDTDPWTWSETSQPGTDAQASGYKTTTPAGRRWGTNRITDEDPIFDQNDSDLNAIVRVGVRDVVSLFTVFDDPSTGTLHEAQAVLGDSGSAVFHKRGAQWELIGIVNAVLLFQDQWNATSGAPNSAMYGNASTFADLSVYRSAILDIMADNPEYSIIGDINLDGEVTGDGTGPIDSDDLSAFVAGWLSEAPEHDIETWKKGDLDLDGDTDLFDFGLLRGAYPAAGAIAGMLGVPEPSTWVLFAVCSLGLIGCRRRPIAGRCEAA